MEGIYTINPDGTNEQQLSTTGGDVSWQGILVDSQTDTPVSSATIPGPPATGAGTPPTDLGAVQICAIIGIALIALLLVAQVLRAWHKNNASKSSS
jgi:hypothetical protein